ncbi:TM2 domain-containing protein 3-like [Oopsacas minuta]|uniref:TM2 domain-containing protein 3-like n=1 Tax=Oopsacas minuta TaxID=111878 RepID=A0AAV7K0A5_9METZ|nr:TM2 domain-containing protein 3-like [Oopsacas minuta]
MLRFNSILFVCLCLCVATVSTQSSCTVAQNCTRTTLNPINSAQYVQCVSGVCACSGMDNCFSLNSSATDSLDACVLDVRCYTYTSLGVCESTARSWLTALLLQIFVGGLGAANFYIGRDDLGGAQLFLFLAVVIFPFFLCCASCCVTAAFSCGDDNICGKICGSLVVLVIILLVIIVVISTFAVSIWFTVDIIIFATNQRPDLNGCTLDQPF